MIYSDEWNRGGLNKDLDFQKPTKTDRTRLSSEGLKAILRTGIEDVIKSAREDQMKDSSQTRKSYTSLNVKIPKVGDKDAVNPMPPMSLVLNN